MIEEWFARWEACLAAADDPKFRDLAFELHVRSDLGFGVWIDPVIPAIRINRGTLAVIQALVAEAFESTDFDLGFERKEQSDRLLCELSFQWLMAHEVSHWLLGHPEFLLRDSPNLLAGFGFAELGLGASGESPAGINRIENICAELQADSLAMEILDHLYVPYLSIDPGGALGKFEELDDPFARLKILTVAAGLVILLIDTLRSSDFYPTPAARIYNLLHIVLGLGNHDAVKIGAAGPVIRGSDDATIATMGRSLRETIMPAGFALEVISRLLDVGTTFIHYDGGTSPTLQDLLLSTGIRKEGGFQTEGAREFDRWEKNLHEWVRTRWMPFARIEVWKSSP